MRGDRQGGAAGDIPGAERCCCAAYDDVCRQKGAGSGEECLREGWIGVRVENKKVPHRIRFLLS